MPEHIYRFKPAQLALFLGTVVVFAAIFQNTLSSVYQNWQSEEYSHGFLIPLISAFLLWQKRDILDRTAFTGSWWGVVLVVLGVGIFFLGTLATISTVDAYAMVIVIAGCLLAVMGWKAFRLAWAPVALLFLVLPIPFFVHANLSSQLQLISSRIGVEVIRLFGISVFLEGNVIDLGAMKLQVVEACSGLRYLFPLMTLGVIVACFFKGKPWQRWLLFLSTIPITVFMNSFRIGVIGVLVDGWGTEQAEGFLHDFEGWVIFMACFALLFLEMWVLARITGDKRPFRDIFALEFPPPRPKAAPTAPRGWVKPAFAALAVLLLAVYPVATLPQRAEDKPARSEFIDFPMTVGAWKGVREQMEAAYLDALKLDDYVMANYAKGDPGPVNFYAAYYASQRTGRSAHTPSSCLPGSGWRMEDFGQRAIPGVEVGGQLLQVNRTVIKKGDDAQLVYYWFQQRGRDLTNEYLVKWFIFWDALTRNRTDGALVRLVTPVPAGEDVAKADERLTDFAKDAVPLLSKYVPD
jgi:exosortase D (VPLPA-CTERM-specific)